MATYINGVTDYVPQIQQFTPDYNFNQSVLTVKQQKYDQGLQQVSSLYGSALDMDLTRDDNQIKKQEFFKDIDKGIKKLAGLDLSLRQNIEQAYGLFNQFLNDKEIQHDAMFTKVSKDELQKAQAFKNCLNPDECGGEWWEGGERLIQLSMMEYKDASAEDALNMTPQEFVPAQNVWKIATDIMKEIDPDKTVEYIDESKTFIVKDKNGEVVTGEVSALLTGILGSDQRIQQFYKAKAKLDRLEFVNANKNKYGSESLANAAYYGLIKQNEQKELEQQIKNTKETISKTNDADQKTALEYLLNQYQKKLNENKENYKFLLGLANAINGIQQVPIENTLNQTLGQPENNTQMQVKINEYMNMLGAIDTALDTVNSWYELAKQHREYIDGYSTDILDVNIANTNFALEVLKMTNPLSYIWSIEGIKGNKIYNTTNSSSVRNRNNQQQINNNGSGSSSSLSSWVGKYGGQYKFQTGGQNNIKENYPFNVDIVGVDKQASDNPLHFSYFGNPNVTGTFNNVINNYNTFGHAFKIKPVDLYNLSPSQFMSSFEGYGYVIDKSGNASNKKMIVGYDSDNNPIVATGKDEKEYNETLEEYKKDWFKDIYGIPYDEFTNAQGSNPIYSVGLANMEGALSVYKDLSYNPGKFSKTFLSLNDDGYTNDFGGAEYNNPEKGIYSSSFSYMSFRGIMADEAEKTYEDYTKIYNNILDAIDTMSKNRTNNDNVDYSSIRNFIETKFNPEQFSEDKLINELRGNIFNSLFINENYISDYIVDDDKKILTETYALLFNNGYAGEYDNLVSGLDKLINIQEMASTVGRKIYYKINGLFDFIDKEGYYKSRQRTFGGGSYYGGGATELTEQYKLNKQYQKAGLIRNFLNYQRNQDHKPAQILFASCEGFRYITKNTINDVFVDEDVLNPKEGDVSNLNRSKVDTKFTPLELVLMAKSDYGSTETGPQSFFNSVKKELYKTQQSLGIDDLYITNSGEVEFSLIGENGNRINVLIPDVSGYFEDSQLKATTENGDITQSDMNKLESLYKSLKTKSKTDINRNDLIETVAEMHSMMNNKEDRPDFESENYIFGIEASNKWQLEDLDENTTYTSEEIDEIWSHLFGYAFKSGSKQLLDLYNKSNLKTDYGSKVYGFYCDYSDSRIITKDESGNKHYDLDKNVNMSYLNDFIGVLLSKVGNTETDFMAVHNLGYSEDNNSKDSKNRYTPFPFIKDGEDNETNEDSVIKYSQDIKNALGLFYYDGVYKMDEKNKVEKFKVYVTPIANNDQRYLGISFKYFDNENKKYDGYTFYVPVDDKEIARTNFVDQYRDNTLLNYIASTDFIRIESDIAHSDIVFRKSAEDGKWYISGSPWMENWRTFNLEGKGDDVSYKVAYGYLDNNLSVDATNKVYNKIFLKDFLNKGWTDEEFAYQYPELLKILENNKRLRIQYDSDLSQKTLNRNKFNNQ